MGDLDCPLDVVKKARKLASQIEARDLPIDFDPGGLSWNQNLLRIARDYTNHDALFARFEDWVTTVCQQGEVDCDFRAASVCGNSELKCPCCSERWLAEQELAQAARAAAERVYQTWLARKALAESQTGG